MIARMMQHAARLAVCLLTLAATGCKNETRATTPVAETPSALATSTAAPTKMLLPAPKYGQRCIGLTPGQYLVDPDRGIGPIKLGMTRAEVEKLPLLSRPVTAQINAGLYAGPLLVDFDKEGLVIRVSYEVGCDGGQVVLPGGALMGKGAELVPYLNSIGNCAQDKAQTGKGEVFRCGAAKKTAVRTSGYCDADAEDGTCAKYGSTPSTIEVIVSSAK